MIDEPGLVSTPMVYFAVESLAADGGIVITASHNPGAYNGFKICREHAIPVGEASGLQRIEAIARELSPDDAPVAAPGSLKTADLREPYVEHVLTVGSGRPSLKVAIDCGNGMASVGLEPLLERDLANGQSGREGPGREDEQAGDQVFETEFGHGVHFVSWFGATGRRTSGIDHLGGRAPRDSIISAASSIKRSA